MRFRFTRIVVAAALCLGVASAAAIVSAADLIQVGPEIVSGPPCCRRNAGP